LSSRPLFLPLGKTLRRISVLRFAGGGARGFVVVPFARVSTDRRFSEGLKKEALKAFVASRQTVAYAGHVYEVIRVRVRAGIVYAVLKPRIR